MKALSLPLHDTWRIPHLVTAILLTEMKVLGFQPLKCRITRGRNMVSRLLTDCIQILVRCWMTSLAVLSAWHITRKLSREQYSRALGLRTRTKTSMSFVCESSATFCCFLIFVHYNMQQYNKIHLCYSPARRSVLGKTVPEVLDTRYKTEGTVFPNTDRPRLVNNIFIFFLNRMKGVRKTRTF